MTTIAWDEEIIAWDSLITMGDEKYVHHNTQKVVSHKGRVFTLCGNAGLLKKTLIPWWEKGHKADAAPDGDWDMVVIGTDGAFLYSSGSPGAEVSTPSTFALGSGSMAARAALMCGKEPAIAVNIAAALDKSTGGPVNWLRLSDHVKKPVIRKSKRRGARK